MCCYIEDFPKVTLKKVSFHSRTTTKYQPVNRTVEDNCIGAKVNVLLPGVASVCRN
jgi:hypothetical protein